jgi:hypothetical protein
MPLPPGSEMSNEDHSAQRQRERDQAVAAMEQALSAIQADNREPDEWERDQLAQAIGCLFRYAYSLAAAHAELALTPADERSRSREPYGGPAFSLSDLRGAFRLAIAEPLRDRPVNAIILTR